MDTAPELLHEVDLRELAVEEFASRRHRSGSWRSSPPPPWVELPSGQVGRGGPTNVGGLELPSGQVVDEEVAAAREGLRPRRWSSTRSSKLDGGARSGRGRRRGGRGRVRGGRARRPRPRSSSDGKSSSTMASPHRCLWPEKKKEVGEEEVSREGERERERVREKVEKGKELSWVGPAESWKKSFPKTKKSSAPKPVFKHSFSKKILECAVLKCSNQTFSHFTFEFKLKKWEKNCYPNAA
ncbi:cytochrome c [Iris pallida]|uniref:Cytochrome c n=1 Tax=Iris pallida TaxID=29817 RepID=A0AAX6HL15_IRIPA|nr:cytochrome c [Iris pallida]